MKAHQRTVGLNDEWITPRYILDALGPFDLDPAAAVNQPWPTAKRMLTVNTDGMRFDWTGRVWLNPPFNRYKRIDWMQKMAEHNNGIMLIPAATETEAFKTYVWPHASGVLFMDHRPHFHYIDGTRAKANSGCSICLVAYGTENLAALVTSGLGTTAIKHP